MLSYGTELFHKIGIDKTKSEELFGKLKSEILNKELSKECLTDMAEFLK